MERCGLSARQPAPPEKDHYNDQWRTGISMNNIQSKMTFVLVVIAVIGLNSAFAQSQTAPTQSDQPSRVSVLYVPHQNSAFQQLHDLLRERSALKKIPDILNPLRLPEELIIKTTEPDLDTPHHGSIF
jgi:hypothetical protein